MEKFTDELKAFGIDLGDGVGRIEAVAWADGNGVDLRIERGGGTEFLALNAVELLAISTVIDDATAAGVLKAGHTQPYMGLWKRLQAWFRDPIRTRGGV